MFGFFVRVHGRSAVIHHYVALPSLTLPLFVFEYRKEPVRSHGQREQVKQLFRRPHA